MDKNNIYSELVELNFSKLEDNKIWDYESKYLKKITKNINKEKITIISWVRNIGKINVISNLLYKTNIIEKSLYFNKDFDKDNIINDYKWLLALLEIKKVAKYIFLQNVWKIDWIKEFISYLYKNDYKLILIWNDIQIPQIKEIEIIKNSDSDIKNTLKYWFIWFSSKLNITYIRENYIDIVLDNIILKSIIELKWVKNIFLYKQTLTFLSKLNSYKSIRDIHRNILESNEISLKTFMDYLEYSIQEKIIKKVPLYDLKKDKEISTQNKYYFSDNWIRNSLTNFSLNKTILKENLLFLKLSYNNYKIYWGVNGSFSFTFLAKKKDKDLYIHISEETDKAEIKKEINKLLKLWDDSKKYLVIDNLEELNIRKKEYWSVELINFKQLQKKEL